MLNGSVSNFGSALVKGFGLDGLKASLLQALAGEFEIVICIVFGYLAQVKDMMGATIIIGCLPGLAGLIGILTIALEHQYALVGCAWLQAVLGSPIILSWIIPVLNVAGHTKRGVVIGIYFVFYCAGNITGPHLFLGREAPRYKSAIKGLIAAYAICMLLQAVYTGFCPFQNKSRDRKHQHVAEVEEALEGFEDLTDLENVHFRYTI